MFVEPFPAPGGAGGVEGVLTPLVLCNNPRGSIWIPNPFYRGGN